MNCSTTDNANAHNVRVDAFAKQMRALSRHERTKLHDELERVDMAEIERSAIARRIKQARKEAGLSQPEMADALGVIPRAYQNYESVSKPRTPWGSMNDIAKITGKTTEWLIHGDARTPDPFPAAGPGDVDQRLREIQQALTVRAGHDQAVDRLLEQQNELLARQSDILTRIEALLLNVNLNGPGEEVLPIPDDLDQLDEGSQQAN